VQKDLGHDPADFRISDFFAQTNQTLQQNNERTQPGINYPFLIPTILWKKLSGLDERFNPGSASDPDFFIRATLLDPTPMMLRNQAAIFYHFAGRSGIYAGGRISFSWKFHWKHSRLMFRHKWGRIWEHAFGQVPNISGWGNIKTKSEPVVAGRLWRYLWFGIPGKYKVVKGIGVK